MALLLVPRSLRHFQGTLVVWAAATISLSSYSAASLSSAPKRHCLVGFQRVPCGGGSSNFRRWSSSRPGLHATRASSAASTGWVEETKRWEARLCEPVSSSVPIFSVERGELAHWLDKQPDHVKEWCQALDWSNPKEGEHILIPGPTCQFIERVIFITEQASNENSPFLYSSLPTSLPKGTYRLVNPANPTTAALSWALGCYSFDRYKQREISGEKALLEWPDECDREEVFSTARSTYLVRDLITTPAEDCGPADIEVCGRQVAAEHGAEISCIVGEELLKQDYRQIFAVGRASALANKPRLLDLTWGDHTHPKVTLIGKGVCFDTGGLNLKPGDSMLLMKKDMGGAAQVLALANMVMAAGLPIRLRVLVPAVENSVDGCSFRPGDVLTAKNGKTTEIGNTDAEGRLILADALVEADSEMPDLIIDCATLTGAARVAVGTEIGALFSNNMEIAREIMDISLSLDDPLWHQPLYKPYRSQIESKIADLKNVGEGPGGAITAALYLQEFLRPAEKNREQTPWVHVDFMGFNKAAKPGRPVGGEAQGMRALFGFLSKRYPPSS